MAFTDLVASIEADEIGSSVKIKQVLSALIAELETALDDFESRIAALEAV